eukprot:9340122-Ditylum_brightwellii.AAC.1
MAGMLESNTLYHFGSFETYCANVWGAAFFERSNRLLGTLHSSNLLCPGPTSWPPHPGPTY